MIFEHFAINVVDIKATVKWYVDHLRLTVVSEQKEAPFMNFLGDATGRVIIEFYHRPDAVITNFSKEHPLTFHVAFVSENAQSDRERLEKEGAVYVEEIKKEDGTHIVMLRDPFGMPLQLCQRAVKF
jgi:catechol 2,3-dioxygenase-like lactoylglutathione lyase family enzyme